MDTIRPTILTPISSTLYTMGTLGTLYRPKSIQSTKNSPPFKELYSMEPPVKKRKNMPNLLGRRFGRLTVVALWDRTPNHGPRWVCRCECGGWAICRQHKLTSGLSRSCGCLKIEAFTTMIEKEHVRRENVDAAVCSRLGLHDFSDL